MFQLFKVIMLEKCLLTVLELIWNQRLGHKNTKLNICHHTLNVVHTTAKQVISRRRKNENVYKMSKNEKCTCKACKNTVFLCQICKFVGFLLPSTSCLLKLPNIGSKSAEFVVGSDSIVTLTHSEGQLTSLRLRGSQLHKQQQKNA